MGKIAKLLTITFFLILSGTPGQGKEYPYRWVYVSRSLRGDRDVADIKSIVRTASEHGLNGMVLSAGLDRLDRRGEEYLARLEQVKQICKEGNIEIIPIIFSVGYGGSILAQDRNLAAGIPVRDALFVAEDGQANLLAEPGVRIVNSGFERKSIIKVRELRQIRARARKSNAGDQSAASSLLQVKLPGQD